MRNILYCTPHQHIKILQDDCCFSDDYDEIYYLLLKTLHSILH